MTPEREQAEREAFESDFDPSYGIAWEAWLARAEIADAEKKALMRYVQHERWCALPNDSHFDDDAKCTCGLDDALTAQGGGE